MRRIVSLKIPVLNIIAAQVVKYMGYYSCSMDEEDKKVLDYLAQHYKKLPLPSGRWGNAIALALENNNYIASEYLIENKERLELDTDVVASELEGTPSCNLKDEYLYSQNTYIEKIPEEINFQKEGKTNDTYQEYINFLIRNKLANERLEKKFFVENKENIKRQK